MLAFMDYLTPKEFGKRFGLTRQAINLRIKHGQIKAMKAAPRTWIIPVSEVKKFKLAVHGKRTWLDKVSQS